LETYVLIQTTLSPHGVAQELSSAPEVLSAVETKGPYDIIALVRTGAPPDLLGDLRDGEGDGGGSIADGLLGWIRRLPGVLHAIPAPVDHSPQLSPVGAGRVTASSRGAAA
jgi:DNA-binding Lrp family transcriptional regulator